MADPSRTHRQAVGTGDPKGRYRASLGHKRDDESGLVYMRARYYEPASGRFVSEDRAREGINCYVYCHADPTAHSDPTGLGPISDLLLPLTRALESADNALDACMMISDVEDAEVVAYRELMNKALAFNIQAADASEGVALGEMSDEQMRIVEFLRDSAADCRSMAKVERAAFKEQIRLERMMWERERDAEL